MTTGRINQVAIPQGTRLGTLLRSASFQRRPAFNSQSALGIHSAGGPHQPFQPSEGNPFYLCHIFPLLRPCKLQAYRCHSQVHGMPRRYIEEEWFFRVSASILGQRPSGTTSIPSLVAHRKTTWLQVRSIHATHRASLVNFAPLSSICHRFVPGNTLPSRAYSSGPNSAQSLLRSFPKPALTLVPEIVYSPVLAATLRNFLDQKLKFFQTVPKRSQ